MMPGTPPIVIDGALASVLTSFLLAQAGILGWLVADRIRLGERVTALEVQAVERQ